MPKVLVLYYSSYGHIEKMAYAAADGIGDAGATATVKRVPELVPEDVGRKSGFKLDQKAPIATLKELPDYDGILIAVPTRFGHMASQMSNFWDQAGGLWSDGSLTGKVGSVISSSATQHGGQEITLFAGITNLLHFGMVIVGLPYAYKGQMTIEEIAGGSPYGATTIAGSKGERLPSDNELAAARYQGKRVAEIAAKLAAG
ncbi:MAG TPA: NAD(P)H:quinone oxidoreductase [Steroidobacteraceae bacterium]|nr:NAD(P)H:quinone oxidoreductase [Steroidobacteraceae bacterium]